MLTKSYQDLIAKRFNIDRSSLVHWLKQINFLRNCAAHHSRIWNRLFTAEISLPNSHNPRFKRYKKAVNFFDKLNLTDDSRYRLFARIAVMWYLISQTSKNYKWLEKVNELLEEFPDVPNAKLKAMGLMNHKYLPLELMKL